MLLPQVAVSVVPTTTGTLDQSLIAQRSQTIKTFFLDQLGLHPFEEGKVYSHFLVPRDKEAQLMPFLKKLEAKSVSVERGRRVSAMRW